MANMTDTILFHKECTLTGSLMILSPAVLIEGTIISSGSTLDNELLSECRVLDKKYNISSTTILAEKSFIPVGTVLRVMKVSLKELNQLCFTHIPPPLIKNYSEISEIVVKITENNVRSKNYDEEISHLELCLSEKTKDFEESESSYKREIEYLIGVNCALKQETDDLIQQKECDERALKSILEAEKENLDNMMKLQQELLSVKDRLSYYNNIIDPHNIQEILISKGASVEDANLISEAIMSEETWKCTKSLESTIDLLEKIRSEIDSSTGFVRRISASESEELSNIVQELNSRLCQKQQQNNNLRTLLDNANEQRSILQSLINDEEKEKETLLSMISDSKTYLEMKDDQCQELERILEDKDEENLRLKEQNQILRGITNDESDNLSAAEERLDTYKTMLDHDRTMFQIKDRRISEIQQQNNLLRSLVEEKQCQTKKLRTILEDVRESTAEVYDENALLHDIVDDDAERIQHYENVVDRMDEQNEILRTMVNHDRNILKLKNLELEKSRMELSLIAQGIERLNRKLQKRCPEFSQQQQQLLSLVNEDNINERINSCINNILRKYRETDDELVNVRKTLDEEIREKTQINRKFHELIENAELCESDDYLEQVSSAMDRERYDLIQQLMKTQSERSEFVEHEEISRVKCNNLELLIKESELKQRELSEILKSNLATQAELRESIAEKARDCQQDDYSNLSEVLTCMMNDYERMQSKYDDLSCHIQTLKCELAKSEEERESYECEIRRLTEVSMNVENSIAKIPESAVFNLAKQREHYKSQFHCSKAEIEKLKEILADYEERESMLECSLAESREKHVELNTELECFKNKHFDFISIVHMSNDETKKTKERLDEFELRHSYLSIAHNDAISEKERLQNILCQQMEEIGRLTSQIDVNEKKIYEYEISISSCSEERQRLDCIIRSMEKKIQDVEDKLCEEKSNFFQKVEEYQEKCRSLKEMYEQSQQRRMATECELKDVKDNLAEVKYFYDEVSDEAMMLKRERKQIAEWLGKALDTEETCNPDDHIFDNIKKINEMTEIIETLTMATKSLSDELKDKVSVELYRAALNDLECLTSEHNCLKQKLQDTLELQENYESLKCQLHLSTMKNEELEAVKTELSKSLESVTKECTKLRKDLEECKITCKSLKIIQRGEAVNEIVENSDQIQMLEQDIEHLREELNQMISRDNNIVSKIVLFDEFDEHKDCDVCEKIESVYKMIKEKMFIIDKLEKENKSLNKMTLELGRENDWLKSSSYDRRGKGTSAGAGEESETLKENDELRSAIGEIIQKSEMLKDESKILETNVQELSSEVLRLNSENQRLTALLEEKQKLLDEVDEHKSQLIAENGQMVNDLNKIHDTFKLKVEEVAEKYDESLKIATILTNSLESLDSKHQKLEQEYQALEAKYHAVTGENRDHSSNEDIDSLKQELQVLNEKYQTTLKLIETLQSESTDDHQKNLDLVNMINKDDKSQELAKYIEGLEKSNKSYEQQLEELTGALKLCSQSEEEKSRKCESYSEQVDELTQRIGELNERIVELAKSNDNGALITELESSKEQIASLSSNLDRVSEDARKLAQHIVELNAQNATDKEQVSSEISKIRQFDVIGSLAMSIQGIFNEEDRHRRLISDFYQRKVPQTKFNEDEVKIKKMKQAYKSDIVKIGSAYNNLVYGKNSA